MNDYYRTLETEPDATQEQIKKQYRFLVQAWHPDKFGSPESKAKAEEKLKQINEAHDVLKDPVKRKQYDRERQYSERGHDYQARAENDRRRHEEEVRARKEAERRQREQAEAKKREEENRARERAERYQREQNEAKEREQETKRPTKEIPFLRITGIVSIVIALFWAGSWAMPKLFSLVPIATGTATLTSVLPTTTSIPNLTPTQLYTLTPNSYTVQEGDSIATIAEKFNLGDDGVLLILDSNPLIRENDGVIYVGQTITIPPPGTLRLTPTPFRRGSKIDYQVMEGDSLAGIAEKFNVAMTSIIIENNIKDANALQVGQVLVIPAIPATYTLQWGEWLPCIARRFNVDISELLELNGLAADSPIYPGQLLRIPQTGNPFIDDGSLHSYPAQYTVVSSDETISGIACMFGDVFPEDIALVNGLSLDSSLVAGQVLSMP